MQSASTCTVGGSGQILDKKPSEADSKGMILEDESFDQNSCRSSRWMQLKFLIKG
jgi:hypothetical protein